MAGKLWGKHGDLLKRSVIANNIRMENLGIVKTV